MSSNKFFGIILSVFFCGLALQSAVAETQPNPIGTYVIENPDGQTAVYLGDVKVGEGQSFKLSPKYEWLITGKGPTPTPDPSPSPKPPKGKCGDIECPPKDPPKPPEPKCHGPFCPGGTPFFESNKNILIYKNRTNINFPEKLDFQQVPEPVRMEMNKIPGFAK
ncbi:hypothetical protein [Pseudomonas sp. FYR_5]|uniref:hypothetical protein n=1 Tax=Pseudomonas sp. FYR_5 TaxID=3367173 RepID=UPI00370A7663